MANPSQSEQRSIIAASEVGEYVFCAKAWQLKRDGVAADSPRLDAGRVFHAQHGARLARSRYLRQAGWALAWIAGLLLIGLLAWWCLAGASG